MRGSGRGFGDDAGDLFGSDQVETAEEQQTNVDTVRRKNSTKERPNENWKETGPKMRCDLLSMAPQYALWHQEECTGKKVVLQSRIDSAFKFHTVNCDKCSVQPEVVSSYQAVYNGVDFAFPLLIPVWRCLGCQQEFLPQPIHVGCFGSTPIRPHTWFDLKLFHQYAVLFRHGTSCTAYVEGLNSSSSCFGVHGGHAVDPEVFQGAYFAFRRVTDQLNSLKGLGVEIDSSPLHVCPICSPRPDEGDPYAVSLAMDAVNKCSHLAHAGNDMELKPYIHNFFGKGEQEVADLEKKGCLDSIKSFKQHTSLLEGDDLEVSNCGSRLRCAREGSKATTMYDVNGLLGATCAHGFALPDLFCNMRRSENFTFYLVLLKHIVKECPSVKHVYIDFGCRLAKTWTWYLQALDKELPPSAVDLRIMVNWMHAASHDMSCQLENSGRFQKDAGFVVGEQSEQLWAMTKDPSSLMRCMTLQNRHDSVECLLSDINDLKLARLVLVLKAKMDSMHKKLAELDQRLDGIQAESNAAGIHDLHAAAQEFLGTQFAVSPTLSERPFLEAEYVRLREMDIAVQKLQSIGFSWKEAGGMSPAALLLRGSTHKEQRELQAKLTDLEIKLAISPDSVWTVDSNDYTRGFKLLAEQQILRYQSAIDVIVHELNKVVTRALIKSTTLQKLAVGSIIVIQ
uniref:CxC3 like cysteine cluster domain-containing protein n=2 Tax=Dunaliella tertiolecta TaxID=3047 RepID=A0A7S3QP61_DUNTE